jgi:hypothetical protein
MQYVDQLCFIGKVCAVAPVGIIFDSIFHRFFGFALAFRDLGNVNGLAITHTPNAAHVCL